MNILEAIKKGSKILKKSGVETSKLDSEILMSQVIQKNRVNIILNSNNKLSKNDFISYKTLIKQRSNKKPISYLTGKKEFWKYEFHVTKDVLIPRPDTEIIVEKALKLTTGKKSLKILDVGVGSGCIILSILKERNNFYGTGVDINKKTLKICKFNSIKLNISSRLKLFKSDIDNFNYGKYDLIISNPPYIKKHKIKYLVRDIFDYEPKSALDGGLDGLSELKKVIISSSKLIKKNGLLILEIGFDQAEIVKKILKQNGFYIREVVKDFAGLTRCVISIKN